MVKLLIIDEVHLLNDERGAVIETIVARTLRQVRTSYLLDIFILMGFRLNLANRLFE
jgi:antiviral helicase SLH1